MTRFLWKVGLLALPFLLYAGFIIATDPFDIVLGHSLVSEQTKLATAALLNPPLWKMNKFVKSPKENVQLGDSRMGHLRAADIRDVSGEDYFNFSFGGASLQEMIDTFWFAARRTNLKNVIIGMNFNVYNDPTKGDKNNSLYSSRCGTYEEVRANPLVYMLDWDVMQSAVYGAEADWLHINPQIGIPNMSRQAFWRHQLDYGAKMYHDYQHPARYYAALQEVAAYCRRNKVGLTFIIFPSYIELQNMVETARLTGEYERFKNDLAGLAVTYDYDLPTELTTNADNFADPFHFKDSVGNIMIREIWQQRLHFGRRLGGDVRSDASSRQL
jgi:hypothetical protein